MTYAYAHKRFMLIIRVKSNFLPKTARSKSFFLQCVYNERMKIFYRPWALIGKMAFLKNIFRS